MAKHTESQSKAALALVGEILAARDSQREESPLRRADFASDPQIRSNRRAIEALAASHAVKTGLDPGAVEQIIARNQIDLQRVVATRKAEAIKQSGATLQALHQIVERRIKAFAQLAGGAGAAAHFVLDTPLAITQTPGVIVDASNVEAFKSFAKIRLHSSDSFDSKSLTFWFFWINPNDRVAVITVDGLLAAIGFCTAGSDGGFFPGDRHSDLTISAGLSLLLPGSDVPQTSAPVTVAFLHASSGGFMDVGDIEVQNVFRGYDLQVEMLLVPPSALVLIQVMLTMTYSNSEGTIDIDFSTGDFDILCPLASVSVLS